MRTQVQVVHASEAKATPRRTRKPQHTFLVHSRPYEITPFMLAPVLPGETLTNLLMQSRCVSDPILNKLIGWWKEYFFFYVPITAMTTQNAFAPQGSNVYGTFDRADTDNMFLDPATTNMTANYGLAADDVGYHSFKAGIPYLKSALKVITGVYFRDEDDTTLTAIDKYPGAYIDRQNGFQSLLADNATGDDTELPGIDDIEEQNILPTWTTEYAKWEIMRDNGMTDLTYDDYIRSQGVQVGDGHHVAGAIGGYETVMPELVRFVRKWTYPTNHVEPTTGVPTSALAWSIAERADKRRFFKQPGFLVGVTVTRPKIYLSSQKGNLAELFRNYKGWPSVVLKDHPYTSLQKEVHSATDSVLRNQATQDYWLDLADIYRYGDQFVNIAHAVADTHGLAFPADVAGGATNADRVPTLAQVKSFFVDAAGTKNLIREDGVVHLDIQSRSIGRDTTVGGG